MQQQNVTGSLFDNQMGGDSCTNWPVTGSLFDNQMGGDSCTNWPNYFH